MNIAELILLIAATVALLFYIMIHIPQEQRKRFDKKLGDIGKIHAIMDRLRFESNIQRVLIWKSENGGGVARFGSKLKLSVVYESYEFPFRSVREDYQDLEADGHAIEVLIKMQQNGETAYFTDQMKEGILRRINENDGAMWSILFAIGPGDGKAFYYASASTSEAKTPYQVGQGLKIELAKKNLRAMYKHMNNTPIKRFKKALYIPYE